MRVLFIILMVLGMLVSTGMGLMIANENVGGGDGAKKADQAIEMLEAMPDSDKKQELIATLQGYKKSGYGGAVVGILALVMVIVTFMKKEKAVLAVAGATIAAAVLFIILSPSAETGANGPAAPRMQAMVYGISGILAAVFGFLAEKKRQA